MCCAAMDEPQKIKFQKVHRTDKIWWVHTEGCIGELKISFDKKTIINLWTDYHRLSPEQKEMFDKENPFWADFFGDERMS